MRYNVNGWIFPCTQPGLDEIVKECRGKNLFFSTDVAGAIVEADLVFVSVNTPTKTYGLGKGSAADVKYIELCARQIAEVSKSDKIIIEKSTVPSGTAATLKAILSANSSPDVNFQVCILFSHLCTRLVVLNSIFDCLIPKLLIIHLVLLYRFCQTQSSSQKVLRSKIS